MGDAAVDLNTNGLSDVWEVAYSARHADPSGDPDGDGQSNADEALAGTNPFDEKSLLKLESVRVVDAAQLLRWRSVAGKLYRVEAANSAENPRWVPLDPQVPGTGSTVVFATPATNPPWSLFRVRITPPNPAVAYARADLQGVDTDGDGVADIDEFEQGTDPFDPGSCLKVEGPMTGSALLVTWDSIAGKVYRIDMPESGSPSNQVPSLGPFCGTGSRLTVALNGSTPAPDLKIRVFDKDSDNDGITDWECLLTATPVGSAWEPPPSPASLTNGLVSHWTLDETGPGDRLDEGGHRLLHDVHTNVVCADRSRFGRAALFDPARETYLVESAAAPAPVERTLTAWISLSGDVTNRPGPQHVAGWSTGAVDEFSIAYTAIPQPHFQATMETVSVGAPLHGTTNTWYFLCARFDGTNLSLSVNGDAAVMQPAFAPAQTTTPFTVGATSEGNHSLRGCVDDVRYWSRPLTDLEVAQLYWAANPRRKPAGAERLKAITKKLAATNLLCIDSVEAVANTTTGTAGEFQIVRSGNVNALTVRYSVEGDAVANEDYQALNGVVSMPAGTTAVRIPVVPLRPPRPLAVAVRVTLNRDPAYGLCSNATAEVHIVRESPMSVTEFGARGDGRTDDTRAIQAAIGALEASTEHNALHFPAGIYRLGRASLEQDAIRSWHQILHLGRTDLAGRDLFLTGEPGSVLHSTINDVRSRILMVNASFRSLTFRGLTWEKDDRPLPATTGEPNGAEAVWLAPKDLRRVEAISFLDCSFNNCHGAVAVYGNGYDLRGRLALFRFIGCQVRNPFGSNTIDGEKSFGGGQQVRVNPWVQTALYANNLFEGRAAQADPVRNPGGVPKDGSHFGSPLQLVFTNNIVRRMGVEAVFQQDDPYMGTTVEPLRFPPADDVSTAHVRLYPEATTFTSNQLLNIRTPRSPTSQPRNALVRVVSFDAVNHRLTIANPGLTPGIEGTSVTRDRPIYLQEYNPTHATIVGNVVETDIPEGAATAIASNCRATIRENFMRGYHSGVMLYDNVRNVVAPPTPGTRVESNIILTTDPSTIVPRNYRVYGVRSWGPGDFILKNLVIAPSSTRFTGVAIRGRRSWVEGNTLLALETQRHPDASSERSLGIGFGVSARGGTAAGNRTYGLDVGVGPEVLHHPGSYEVLDHESHNDTFPAASAAR